MCVRADAAADAYAVLGVPRSASPQQVRRAYKTLCLRWHPDKHPPGAPRRAAERHFKAISVAYAAVSERQSRRAPPPPPPPRQSSPATSSSSRSRNHYAPPGADHFHDDAFFFHDVFDSDDDDDDDDYQHRSGSMSCRSATRHEDLVLPLPLTLGEFATGCTKQHRLHTHDDDAAAAVAAAAAAAAAGGTKLLRVVVKPGYRPGDRIRFRNVRADGGDVLFTLTLSNAPPWSGASLRGDDVHMTQRIALVDALTGGRISVCTPRGTRLLRVLPVITPGATRVVPACGLPCRADPRQFGDVVVRFDVLFPTKVDEPSRARLREVFARLERPRMRRCSSVFSAKAFRRHEQPQKRSCSYCERHDSDDDGLADAEQQHGAPQPLASRNKAPGRGRRRAGSSDEQRAGSSDEQRAGSSDEQRAAPQAQTPQAQTPQAQTPQTQQRLRTMFVKSSSKLAAVFR